MVITFVSNYINHHQLPFCKALDAMGDVEFHFVQTQPMEQKRIDMGWAVNVNDYPFVHLMYERPDTCKKLILESDVTIFGWTDGAIEDLEKERLSSEGKISYRISERIYREGQFKAISPRGLIKKYHEHYVYRLKDVFLLCAGAYVSSDFALIHCYPYSMLKWGYFPDTSKADALPERKGEKITGRIKLLWAGRLISLKHPEFAVKAAKDLSDKGYDFELDIIGDGYLKEDLSKMVSEFGLTDKVHLLGSKAPEEVIASMKDADVFLFTSNYLEGWGAVVNEAMMCACAVVGSYEAGSVPFLIKDGQNGLSYEKGAYSAFMDKLLYLFENRDKIREFGFEARKTIKEVWNAENAAKEFVRFSKEYLEGLDPSLADEGPMSNPEILKAPGLVRSLQEKNRLE